jgi:hypothetical protein
MWNLAADQELFALTCFCSFDDSSALAYDLHRELFGAIQ